MGDSAGLGECVEGGMHGLYGGWWRSSLRGRGGAAGVRAFSDGQGALRHSFVSIMSDNGDREHR